MKTEIFPQWPMVALYAATLVALVFALVVFLRKKLSPLKRGLLCAFAYYSSLLIVVALVHRLFGPETMVWYDRTIGSFLLFWPLEAFRFFFGGPLSNIVEGVHYLILALPALILALYHILVGLALLCAVCFGLFAGFIFFKAALTGGLWKVRLKIALTGALARLNKRLPYAA